jgi:tetratricopeptide (TPR) repeat protein
LAVKRTLGDRPYESLILANLGLLATHRQQYQTAVNYCREALQISQALGERAMTAYAQNCLGEALIGLGWLPEAADVLGEAIQIRQALGQADQTLEPVAGLAAVYLASGQNGQAQGYVEQILPHLKLITAAAIVDPFRIFWICYEVLTANQDLRASEVLAEAHAALQTRAARIGDAAMRQRYLEGVAVNRQILAAYAQVAPQGGAAGANQWRQRVEQHTDLVQDLERLLHVDDES